MGYLHFLNAAFHLHQNLSLVLGSLDFIPYLRLEFKKAENNGLFQSNNSAAF